MAVYFSQLASGTIKIGQSAWPVRRLDGLSSYYKQDVTLLAVIPGDDSTEVKVQEQFADLLLPGKYELFRPGNALMSYIARIKLKKPILRRYLTREQAKGGRELYMTPKRVAQVGKMLNSGLSGPKVAKKMKVSTASVYAYWKQSGPGKFVRRKPKA